MRLSNLDYGTLRNICERALKATAIFLINSYRLLLSPIFGGRCRFYPSCSQYGIEAYQEHSFFKATSLIMCRLLKCHPLGPQGYDPIPGKENV